MGLFKKKYIVSPNNTGYFFKDNKFFKTLTPGIYKFYDPKKRITKYELTDVNIVKVFTNQEILTKDNIALRFSYSIIYKIKDGLKLLGNLDLSKHFTIYDNIEEYIHNLSQISIRDRISKFSSEDINEKRNEVFEKLKEELNEKLTDYGIEINIISIRDITFPKMIQELFSKLLESKIRAKSDLENAKTQVAAARALKNASEIIKNDDNVKFFHYLEVLNKIAAKGKHTFVIGEVKNILDKIN